MGRGAAELFRAIERAADAAAKGEYGEAEERELLGAAVACANTLAVRAASTRSSACDVAARRSLAAEAAFEGVRRIDWARMAPAQVHAFIAGRIRFSLATADRTEDPLGRKVREMVRDLQRLEDGEVQARRRMLTGAERAALVVAACPSATPATRAAVLGHAAGSVRSSGEPIAADDPEVAAVSAAQRAWLRRIVRPVLPIDLRDHLDRHLAGEEVDVDDEPFDLVIRRLFARAELRPVRERLRATA